MARVNKNAPLPPETNNVKKQYESFPTKRESSFQNERGSAKIYAIIPASAHHFEGQMHRQFQSLNSRQSASLAKVLSFV